MNFEDLKDPELQKKLKSAKSLEELVALAKKQGMDLSEEQLETLSGGTQWYEICDGHGDCHELPHHPV